MRLSSATTVEPPPQREAPGAGRIPPWENRPGKSPDEFLQSDLSQPDLSAMWECPLTRWDSEKYVEHLRLRIVEFWCIKACQGGC